MKRRIGIVSQNVRSGATLVDRAVISPASTTDEVDNTESTDDVGDQSEASTDRKFNKPIDPSGLKPVGSFGFLGLALAVAGGWMLFGNKK